MISINNLQELPEWRVLQNSCKAMSVLDAILSQDWIYRYSSYNSEWSENEEFFEMRNGEGDQLLILFTTTGAVINGYLSEADQEEKEKLTAGLPEAYHEFIFGEPVNSTGTTFCIWTTADGKWTTGHVTADEDKSEELLSLLDGKPETYITWATDYFKGSYKENGIPRETVGRIFNGEMLTIDMILSIIEVLEDAEQLKEDLIEISYPYHIIE
ncbi:MAG: hypothetical protein MUP99_09680 [Pedobacter sp.]|nr:hypothetical protein [Pedobacter sp.]